MALRLEDDLRAELEQQAERQGRPVSNLARAVLRQWIANQQRVGERPA